MNNQKNESPIDPNQKAELTVDQLREVVAGQVRPDFIKRARGAGLSSMADLKGIIHKSSDTHTGGSLGTSVTSIDGLSPAGGISPND